MLKLCILLINLVIASTAHAQFSYTGFVYTTQFSDNDWLDNRTVAAINTDYAFSNGVALRGQVTTYKDQIIRRAVVEYAHPLTSNIESVYQLGRFARLDSFFNGITDNPSTYGMAIPPNAGYSYRMFNGAFAIMDGAQWQITYKSDSDYLIRGRLAYGSIPVPNQSEIVQEAFKQPIKGVELYGRGGSYDAGLHFETRDYHIYASRNMYLFETSLTDSTVALARTADSQYRNIDYWVDKFGIKYDNSKWFTSLELFHDYTDRIVAHTTKKIPSGDSLGGNLIIGGEIIDKVTPFIGRSYGYNKIAKTYNMDKFMGVTYDESNYTVTVEYHRGHGFAWRKYDAPTVTSPNVPQWSSWVVSATYRF